MGVIEGILYRCLHSLSVFLAEILHSCKMHESTTHVNGFVFDSIFSYGKYFVSPDVFFRKHFIRSRCELIVVRMFHAHRYFRSIFSYGKYFVRMFHAHRYNIFSYNSGFNDITNICITVATSIIPCPTIIGSGFLFL